MTMLAVFELIRKSNLFRVTRYNVFSYSYLAIQLEDATRNFCLGNSRNLKNFYHRTFLSGFWNSHKSHWAWSPAAP